ncbi:MAG: mannose-6-phosphate isomerase, class I [Catonella sp.]|uniref:mannose-6-phosphate isomerase, class I n=1 Tax=Catonella sp. TaxID=2382125 RepID=UPI003FA12699
MQPLFLKSVFKEMIWGGTALRDEFNYDIPSNKTGECWAISAHKNGDCIVETREGSEYSGKTLSKLWSNDKELWGKAGEAAVFPLLTKLISAETDLSIQVHPNDEYAKANENGSLGKTECWYIVDAKEDATIVIGHNAKDKAELNKYIESKDFLGLIREIPVKKGDFFFIEPGTVHAIKGGTIILETQQNSDITYRLYDYDRLQDGKPRELHIDKCLDVIDCPFEVKEPEHRKVIEFEDGSLVRNMVICSLFEVDYVKIESKVRLSQNTDFTLVSVLEGSGKLKSRDNSEWEIKKGEHFILPYGFGDYELTGSLELIVSGSH